jgi:antitoxin PrlF
METAEITSLSSRGQIVIPQSLREKMKLKEGEKFAIAGDDDTIVLRKIEQPSMNELLAKIRAKVKASGITPADVEKAIRSVRNQ